MTKKTNTGNKLSHGELINCLDVFCRANCVIAKTDPQLSKEMLSVIETLTFACSAEQSITREEEERINRFCKKYDKIEEGTITDLFTGDIIYKG